MGKKTIVFLATLCMSLVLACNAEAARQTRDLVFEEEPQPAAASTVNTQDTQVVAVKATIELNRDGQISTVVPSHEFKSGDRVKLIYTPSIDGYAYWLAKGSTGKTAILFPSAQAGSDNRIERNKEYTIPARGSFRFDDTVGKEELLCIISAERVPELDKLIAENNQGVIPAESSAPVAQIEEKNTSKRQTRDLVFEEEETEDVVTKTQVAPKSEPFVTYFVLSHK